MATMTAQVNWPRPPVGGYTADDLDRLPNLPAHTELIDGSLVFVSPQKRFHMAAIDRLAGVLRSGAPEWASVQREMAVRLAPKQQPEPDVLVLRAAVVGTDPDATFYPPDAVVLAVEIISPDSELRDRNRKPSLYAEAGIPFFWLGEQDGNDLVVATFRLEGGGYLPTGVHRGRLQSSEPFPLDLDLTQIVR